MDYLGSLVDRLRSSEERRAVGGIGCEERSANGVEGHGEDGEDEGDESPAGAEGGDDHGGRSIS